MQRDDGLGAAMEASYNRDAAQSAQKAADDLQIRVSKLETLVDDLFREVSRLGDRLYDVQGHGG